MQQADTPQPVEFVARQAVSPYIEERRRHIHRQVAVAGEHLVQHIGRFVAVVVDNIRNPGHVRT